MEDTDLFVDADISNCKNFLLTNVKSKQPEIHLWSLKQTKIVKKFNMFVQQDFQASC